MQFDERYRAIQSRDSRFDGQFFTAVHSTGIYCRPSCPARTPKPANVTFFSTSAAAHEAGFRACKRCLPEATPGTPQWNLRDDLSARAMRLIGDGVVEREGVPGLASRLGYSSRHLTRVLTDELGAGPLALSRAHRAQTARTLLTSTDLPVGEVAYASGFASVRAFNDTIAEVFALTPREIRARRTASMPAPGTIDLTLPVRAPFDPTGTFLWLAARAVTGVEVATSSSYSRTLALAGGPAWFTVTPAPGGVRLVASLAELRDLPSLVTRVRRLFDLDADPVGIDAALRTDPLIAPLVDASPGIRLPGTVDPDEMVFRAIIGQQITVAAARTQLGRLAATAGTPIADAPDGLTTLFPAPAQIALRGREAMVGPRAKIDTVMTVAAALAEGSLSIGFGDDRAALHSRFTAVRGIGDWTAGYLAMRVLGNPDVLLTGDVALRAGARRLGFADTVPELVARSAPLSPWRSYLSLHLWAASAAPTPPPTRKDPS
ncbi:AlkA N-terminal domain-containing protein [Herbiconiux sp. L3-i23]|uniref:AlkA N-terminal domain-containing protein n=1 Tax=Herbiconiux sp. L3-i23 TaxID=2905871 RepID=UPI0020562617|nr:AlkA N-terminal domain-containing protein [Herbiconiux sp. L3-i23]BDI23790.1 DNA-3-methyladenine glycosylase [Herbiconiux sp. L3-i23]